MRVAARAPPRPSPAPVAPPGRQEGASRARARPGKTPSVVPARLPLRLAGPSSLRADRLMAGLPPAALPTPRAGPARPVALLRRWVSAGDLAAPGAETGRPGAGRRASQVPGRPASAAIQTVGLGLRVWKLRPQRAGAAQGQRRTTLDPGLWSSAPVRLRFAFHGGERGARRRVAPSPRPGPGVAGAALRPLGRRARASAGWPRPRASPARPLRPSGPPNPPTHPGRLQGPHSADLRGLPAENYRK